MHKKLLPGLSLLLALSSSLCAFSACADGDPLKYTLSNDGSYYICEAERTSDPKIKEIEIPSVYKGKPVAEIGHFRFVALESVIIPDSVTVIGEEAFSGLAFLKNVSIGNGVEKIERHAFSCCTALESITIPDNVTTMDEQVFQQCYNLKTVSFGAGITKIPSHTFYYCENFKNIVLPDTVEVIDDWAFAICGLESITLGNNLTTIGKYAFRECRELKSIKIPDSITSIEHRAFMECSELEFFFFDSRNVIKFSENLVFDGCSNLKGIFTKHSEYWGGEGNLTPVNLYHYSETKPTNDDYLYWHYVDGEVSIWE